MTTLISKVAESELEKDSRLYFQMQLAEELKMTLSDLKEKVTEEEMILWQLYYSIKSRKQKEEMEKAKRRR
jgi:hypothetical protein